MNARFTFYCHTNRVNGKRYVGQTVDTMEGRWKEHVSAARQNRGACIFGAAIRKYGPEAFDHEVLEVVVTTQKDADDIETRWIKDRQSLSPNGYNLMAGGGSNGHHHEDSKRLIGKTIRANLKAMTHEQRAGFWQKNIHLWTPERRARQRERSQSEKVRENVSEGQKTFWSQFSTEEKRARVLHQLAGMSVEQNANRSRKAWANLKPEARAERVRRTTAGVIKAKSNPQHSAKMSAWQTEQAKLRTPEQRSAMVLKAWETRRAKYGQDGFKQAKPSSEQYSEATRKGWANLTPEARTERGLKIQEGRHRAKEARLAARQPSMRFNLLAPRAA